MVAGAVWGGPGCERTCVGPLELQVPFDTPARPGYQHEIHPRATIMQHCLTSNRENHLAPKPVRREASRFPGKPGTFGILLVHVTCMKDSSPPGRTRSAGKLVVHSPGCLEVCGVGPGGDRHSQPVTSLSLMSPGSPGGSHSGVRSDTSEFDFVLLATASMSLQ